MPGLKVHSNPHVTWGERKEEKILAMGIIILVICVVAGLEIIRELHHFTVTRYELHSSKFAGEEETKQVLFLSDLHNHEYGHENEKLLAAAKRENPALILIGGDMLVGKNGYDFAPALSFVKKLADLCPVYYANGNHEQRMKEHPEQYQQQFLEYKEALEQAGVHFLENESVSLMLGEAAVSIYGLEIPHRYYTHWEKKAAMPAGTVKECIGQCDSSRYNILLAHHPSYMSEYKNWGADLILSGHFHGGVMRLPFLGGVISPNFQLFPRYSGEMHEEGDAAVVVSKGLGTHTICVRLFNPAELVVLKFVGNKKQTVKR